MINAGKYNKQIKIIAVVKDEDEDGFKIDNEIVIASPYSAVKTTSGFTLIASGSDFEKAMTKFTIRYQKRVADAYEEYNRKLFVKYRDRRYSVEYLNNVDEAGEKIELQCKAVSK